MVSNLLGLPSLKERMNGTNKVEKDDWRAAQGPEQDLDQERRGRTFFKIEKGVKPPKDLSNARSSSKPPRISGPKKKSNQNTLQIRREIWRR